MGAASSLETAMEALDDEQLITIVQQAYRRDAARMDKILAVAKARHLQDAGDAVVGATSAAALPAVDDTPPPPAEAVVTPIKLVTAAAERPPAAPPSLKPTEGASAAVPDASLPSTAGGAIRTDRTAALWTFPGHTLRELRSGFAPKKRSAPGADDASVVDADGYQVLFGSCGREKKYARCSVCYFRGVRRNTAHYCACCQRPVCVRPRTYPGEEHPKICWNVLHVDTDMVQRVDKRRARKLHAATLLTDKAVASEDEEAPLGAESGTKASSDEQGEAVNPAAGKLRKTSTGGKLSSTIPPPTPTAVPVALPAPPKPDHV